MQRVLITGASRGIGLEFTRRYLDAGARVFAACRKPGRASALTLFAAQHPGRLSVLPLDVTDPRSIAELAREIGALCEGLDLLINNAGVLVGAEKFGELHAEHLQQSFATNAVGAILVAQAMLPLLQRGSASKLVNISSVLGSITRRDGWYTPSYCISKAALNMATKLHAGEWAARGITAIAMHPGWVKTDMGGADAPLATIDAVAGMQRVIDALRPTDGGRFLDYQGEEIAW